MLVLSRCVLTARQRVLHIHESTNQSVLGTWLGPFNWLAHEYAIHVNARQRATRVMGCLHDPVNVQQTSSKCIQNTLKLLDVCWIV